MQLLRKLTSRYAALVLFAALLPAVWGCDHKCSTSPIAGGGGTPGPAGAGPSFGRASNFEILASSTVTNTGATTTIFGDVGVSPSGSITGIPAGQPTGGSIHSGDAAAMDAQTDVTTAYNALVAKPCNVTMSGVDLGGRTLTGGVYCFASTAQLTGTLTLDGQSNPDAVFVFKIGSGLTTASNSAVLVTNGAQPKNVYWQVTSSAVLGTNTAFLGNIIALSSITLNTGTNITGRALARTGAVTLDTNAATLP